MACPHKPSFAATILQWFPSKRHTSPVEAAQRLPSGEKDRNVSSLSTVPGRGKSVGTSFGFEASNRSTCCRDVAQILPSGAA